MNFEAQSKPISFPDIDFADYSANLSQFSMAAGDFLEIYKTKSKYNA
jgi:hypothetical protein